MAILATLSRSSFVTTPSLAAISAPRKVTVICVPYRLCSLSYVLKSKRLLLIFMVATFCQKLPKMADEGS